MKNFTNPNTTSQEVATNTWNPKETVETLQNISKNIRGYSLKMKETMKCLRESGAIPEFAEAIREGSFALRDTVSDINETTKELKRKGIFVDTANAIEDTYKSAEESIANVKQIAIDSGIASPHASKAIHDGLDLVRKETKLVSGSVLKGFKHKVVA